MSTKCLRRIITSYLQSRVLFTTKPILSAPTLQKSKPIMVINQNVSFIRSYSSLSFDEINLLRNKENICWKCRSEVEEKSKYFCSNCQTILPLNKKEDYFSLFGIKKSFQISAEELQKEFKNLQRNLHPDKFSLKSATELEISQAISSQLNKAYFVLLKPLSRGLYMLELEGVLMGEDVTADDPHFLMEIMELNEQIEDAETIPDLKLVYNEVKTTVDDLTIKIENAFKANNIGLAKSCIISFKYYDNILEKLKDKIPPE